MSVSLLTSYGKPRAQPTAKLISLRMRVHPLLINVSGIVFSTTRAAVMHEPKGLLADIIWGKRPTEIDQDGNIYLKRDPQLFKFLLNYLETGEGVNTIHSVDDGQELLEEARFFGLTKLIEDLENRMQTMSGAFHVVGKNQVHATIKSAMEVAGTNERILVLPGTYNESVVLDKQIRIVGKPGPKPEDQVIVVNAQHAPLVVKCPGSRVQGIWFHRVSDAAPGRRANALCRCGHVEIVHNSETGCDMCDDCDAATAPAGYIVRGPCVDVLDDASVLLKDCHVSCDVGSGIQVSSQGGIDMKGVNVTDCSELGVVLLGGAASLHQCKISGSGLAALGVQQGSEASVQRSIFTKNKDCGVVVEMGRLQLVASEITENSAAGIAISSCPWGEVVIRNCQVRNNQHAGVYVCGSYTVPQLIGLDIEGNGLAGVAASAQANPVLQNCRIYGNKGCGYVASDEGLGQLVRCDVYKNAMAGIAVQGPKSDVRIVESSIHDGLDAGIFVDNQATALIKNCSIYANSLAGIAVSNQASPRAVDCNVHDCRVGISTFSSGLGHFERMDIYQNVTANFAIESDADPTVVRCKMRKCAVTGILIERGGCGVFAGNEICENGIAGIIVRHSNTKPAFSANIIKQNGVGIMCDDECSAAFDQDCIEHNGGMGIVCKKGARPCFSRATVKHNKSVGIVAGEDGRGVFVNCTIAENGGAGVSVGNNARPLFKGCSISSCGDCGVLVMPGGRPELHGNVIAQHDLASVALQGTSDPRLLENKVDGGSMFAILCGDGSFGTFEFNQVKAGGKASFAFIRNAQPVLLNNDVADENDGDFAIYGEAKLSAAPALIATIQQQRKLRPKNRTFEVPTIPTGDELDGEIGEQLVAHEEQLQRAMARTDKTVDFSHANKHMDAFNIWVPRHPALQDGVIRAGSFGPVDLSSIIQEISSNNNGNSHVASSASAKSTSPKSASPRNSISLQSRGSMAAMRPAPPSNPSAKPGSRSNSRKQSFIAHNNNNNSNNNNKSPRKRSSLFINVEARVADGESSMPTPIRQASSSPLLKAALIHSPKTIEPKPNLPRNPSTIKIANDIGSTPAAPQMTPSALPGSKRGSLVSNG